MQKLLKDKSIIEDSWQVLSKDFAGKLPEHPCLVPLNYWLDNKKICGKLDAVGVWLDADQEAELIVNDIANLRHIAVNFPTFMDGRGFTTGRLIRERYHFIGELCAIGQIIPDQLFYLSRCGFDAFCLDALELKNDSPEEHCLENYLATFSITYQACTNEQQPLFRRRC